MSDFVKFLNIASFALGAGLSYSVNHSVLWAFLHGLVGFAYAVYYVVSR